MLQQVPFGGEQMLQQVLPADCFHNILQYTDSHRTLVATYLTCRDFANWYETERDIKITYQSAHYELLHRYGNGKYVHHIENISLEFVRLHPGMDMDWWDLSCRASFEDFIEYSDFPWDVNALISDMPAEYIMANATDNWDWYEISYTPGLTYDFVKNNRYRLLSYDFIIMKMDLTWEQLVELFPARIRAISMHQNTTLNIIENYPEYRWDWDFISENPNLTWDFVLKNPDKPWSWSKISQQDFVDVDLIKKYPNYDWDFEIIAHKKKITAQDILDNIELLAIPGLLNALL